MKKVILLISALVFAVNSFAADKPVQAPKIEEGKQYIVLDKFASPEKEAVEFFSFNCSACYAFEAKAKGGDYLQAHLPDNVSLKKYHLDNFGPLSEELAQAWAVASVLNIRDQVAPVMFNRIHVKHNLKTANDIVNVFADLGITPEKYQTLLKSVAVQAFLAQQKSALDELRPSRIPAFVINGKYLVNNQGLAGSTMDDMVKEYSRVVNYLLTLH